MSGPSSSLEFITNETVAVNCTTMALLPNATLAIKFWAAGVPDDVVANSRALNCGYASSRSCTGLALQANFPLSMMDAFKSSFPVHGPLPVFALPMRGATGTVVFSLSETTRVSSTTIQSIFGGSYAAFRPGLAAAACAACGASPL